MSPSSPPRRLPLYGAALSVASYVMFLVAAEGQAKMRRRGVSAHSRLCRRPKDPRQRRKVGARCERGQCVVAARDAARACSVIRCCRGAASARARRRVVAAMHAALRRVFGAVSGALCRRVVQQHVVVGWLAAMWCSEYSRVRALPMVVCRRPPGARQAMLRSAAAQCWHVINRAYVLPRRAGSSSTFHVYACL